MASYTRQSTFVDGDTITAAIFNNEFNQLLAAFNNSTGHKHDGTTAEGPVIGLIGDAGETSPNNKVLIDTSNNHIEFYVEVSSSSVQQLRIQDGAVVPITDSDVDLGTSSLYFKDAFIDSITTTGNVSVGGNLDVTGTIDFSDSAITNVGSIQLDSIAGDADSNTSITFSGSDVITIAAGGDNQVTFTNGAIVPSTDNDIDLGTSSVEFKDAFFDGTVTVDAFVADTADINGGTVDGATIGANSASTGAFTSVTTTGNVDVGGNLTVTGTTTFNGGTLTLGDSASDNVVFGADVDSSIIPDDDDTYDLGSSSQEWRNLFIDGTANIDSLVADTADINGGTVDGAVIGGASAAAITGTTITGTSFVIGSADISEAELETIDGVTAGTVAASKAIVVDSNKDFTGARNITLTGELDAGSLDVSGDVDVDGTLETDALSINGTAVTSTAAELNILDGVTSTAAELNILDGVTSTAAELNILDGVTASAADINLIDGITNGTVIASKAIITDSNKDITGGRNITISGELDAATLDISGNGDVAGTLDISGGSTNGVAISQGAIAIKNGGTQSYVDFYCESSNAHYARLQAPAHSAFSGNITATLPATTGTLALTSDDITGTAAVATSVTVSANNSTDETIFPVFVDGATGSQGLETDTGFTYNPSSGNLTIGGALTAASLDISGDVDIDGTLEADAITVNGTTLAETISDTVGAMVSSNTETGIAVTYDDSDNTLDFVIGADVIVNSMIADDAIDSAQIADGSIDTAHIANDQVTGDKLSNDVTIANDLTVSGNLVVTGSTTQTGSLLSNSNFQALSQNNSGNSTDFGFYGKYVESSTTKYAGLYFDASTDNTFALFVDSQTAPSTTVNTGATGYAVGSLVANVTGNLTGNASGTAATVTGAAQSNITSLGTLTTLTVDNVIINGTTIGHTSDTDLITLTANTVTVAGLVDATTIDGENFKVNGAQGSDGQVLTSTGSGVAWEDAGGGGATSDADGDTKIQVEESSDEDKIRFDTAGTERLVLDNNGHLLPGANNTYDLGATATRWRNIYTNDLQLSNEQGDANEVDNTKGSWTIQEGAEDLFIINRKTGKQYKFKLEEV